MRRWGLWLVLLAVVIAAGCSGTPTEQFAITMVPAAQPTSAFTDPLLSLGQQTYQMVCAHCHGYQMQGQLAESIPDTQALGMHTVPSLGTHGHAWQHPDQLLVRTIREGIQNPLDQYQMPAMGEELSDREIRAVLAYIKLWWTEDQRATQAALTENWAARTEALGLEE